MATSLEEGNSEFKPVKLRLKIDPRVASCMCWWGWVNMHSGCITKAKEPSLPYCLLIVRRRKRYSCLSQIYQRKVEQLRPGFELFLSNPFSKTLAVLWGSRTEGQGQRAKLCSGLISDSIFRLFYFTPRWLVGVTPCPRKSQKELYKRRQ